MKKVIFVFCCLLITGCSLFKNINNTPSRKVEEFMMKYQNLDDDVISDLDNVILSINYLDEEGKKEYKSLMKKHYQNLTYEIKDERIDGNRAIVTVEIEVFDYSKIIRDANNTLQSYPERFQNESGDYDELLFNKYRLEKLKDAKDKIKYTLDLSLTKKDKQWQLDNLSGTDIDKINGTYIY